MLTVLVIKASQVYWAVADRFADLDARKSSFTRPALNGAGSDAVAGGYLGLGKQTVARCACDLGRCRACIHAG